MLAEWEEQKKHIIFTKEICSFPPRRDEGGILSLLIFLSRTLKCFSRLGCS